MSKTFVIAEAGANHDRSKSQAFKLIDVAVNSAADALAAKTVFNPSFSAASAALDAVITVTGVPSGTEVFVDGTSKGTMSDTTLTFTAKDAGQYVILLQKDKYVDHTTEFAVNRYT